MKTTSVILTLMAALALLLLIANRSETQTDSGGIFEARIGTSDDDAEQRRDGTVSRSSKDLQLTFVPGGHQQIGLRWDEVQIPRGATITAAWVQFQSAGSDDQPAELTIRGELAASADTFYGRAYNIGHRSDTDAAVTWTPAPWTSAGSEGAEQRTPDLSAVIEEIVAQPGWYPGHALALTIAGTGVRTAVSYDGDPVAAPLLHVEYRATPAPRPPLGSVTVVAAGDIACDPRRSDFNDGWGTAADCRQLHVANLVLSIDPDAVLTLGDSQYQSGTLEQFNNSYHPSWGRLRDITYPAVGDHEYLDSEASGYFAYFAERAGDPARGYYSYDLGAWHLVVLNSNCNDAGGCGADSPQVQWLRADLAANRTDCTLAYWHHPRFSSGKHGDHPSTTELWRVLYEAGAEIVLAGDDHHYERLQPADHEGNPDPEGGIRSWVLGVGGDSTHTDGLDTPIALSEVRSGEVFGVLKLDLYPGGYDWTFVKESGPPFEDSGSGSCH